ncbi:zf-HC2 domain-containing protein [Roseateles saccharophilus]|uniref:Putative zinc finger protein n=1 Tax=Roseateles saccharophilus TaxID=304 RepID=A0A4R3VDZ1_ROSSA|nr:zf-HC2 domain-containing protein [Roseateles saccharophilus]MDG0835548.1 zf-HC2 domain-containing protein [Roseateles saccharophilus]TCV03576.1 putative zinc finger protein [Roseateles saccharophilus]
MSVVVRMEYDEHVAAQALLPWLARGQLGEAERQWVEQHLLHCPACRDELAAEGPMQALLNVAGALPEGGDVEAGLARLHARMQPVPELRPRPPRWMPWALGLQGMAVAALLALWLQARNEAPDYQGLSAAAAPGTAPVVADALVMFKPGTSERQLRELLQAHDAGIVAGPTETGAWLLRVDARGLAALRVAPIVQMAEPLQPGPPR